METSKELEECHLFLFAMYVDDLLMRLKHLEWDTILELCLLVQFASADDLHLLASAKCRMDFHGTFMRNLMLRNALCLFWEKGVQKRILPFKHQT